MHFKNLNSVSLVSKFCLSETIVRHSIALMTKFEVHNFFSF